MFYGLGEDSDSDAVSESERISSPASLRARCGRRFISRVLWARPAVAALSTPGPPAPRRPQTEGVSRPPGNSLGEES